MVYGHEALNLTARAVCLQQRVSQFGAAQQLPTGKPDNPGRDGLNEPVDERFLRRCHDSLTMADPAVPAMLAIDRDVQLPPNRRRARVSVRLWVGKSPLRFSLAQEPLHELRPGRPSDPYGSPLQDASRPNFPDYDW